MRRVAVVLAVAVLGCLGAASAVAAHKTVARKAPAGLKFYVAPSPVPGKTHGDLIWSRAATEPKLPDAGADTLVLYRSISPITGKAIAVSGTVAIPRGTAPKGGWPVITWAHGTTGIADQCAPSRLGVTATSPIEDAWLKAGYAVANTDYEGLGTPGTHPYLIGVSEGRGVLDIVRAARQLYPGMLSANLAISGHSQGGQSALFAAALAPKWTPELKLHAVVAFAPVSHLEDQTSLLGSVSATGLSGLVAMIFRGIDTAAPALNVASLLTPQAAALYPQTLTKCLNDLDAPDSFGSLPLDQLVQPGTDLTRFNAVTKANDAAFLHIKAPVLIEQGLADTTVIPAFTQMLQAEYVAAGNHSTLHTYAGVTHTTVIAGAPAADATALIEKLLPPH